MYIVKCMVNPWTVQNYAQVVCGYLFFYESKKFQVPRLRVKREINYMYQRMYTKCIQLQVICIHNIYFMFRLMFAIFR